MRRVLKNGIAWTLSTAAAGTLSWWGVHTVLEPASYTRPPALPDTGQQAGEAPAAALGDGPGPSARPARPARQEPAGDGGHDTTEKPSPGTPSAPPPSTAPADAPADAATASAPEPSAGAGSNTKGYTVDGGRVTFDMREDHAELVSAVPHPGWRMQVWKHPQWIRVSFVKDDREIAVFCSWHQHPPLVEIEEQ
ncbi:hypothetical protein ABZ023_22120 [Streptomyces sp. NPDC006367]|uniref:hypothetical protein n=1 Tax=unclassified Streptomyces TaxID=2593676 RepID=UPI0033B7DD50